VKFSYSTTLCLPPCPVCATLFSFRVAAPVFSRDFCSQVGVPILFSCVVSELCFPSSSGLWVRRHSSTPSVERPKPPCARALPYGRKSTQQQSTTSVWCWSAQARMPACLLRQAPPPRQRRRGGGRPPPTGRTGTTYGCREEQIGGWPPVSVHACTPMGARRACV